MTAVRNLTIAVSVLSIAILTTFWLTSFRDNDGIAMDGSIFVALMDVFYVLLLWIPYKFRDSLRAAMLNRVSFMLSVLPAAAIIMLLLIGGVKA